VLKGITYRTRFQFLIVTSLLLAIFVYQLGVRKTVNAISSYQELSNKTKEIEQAPQRLGAIRKELKDLDRFTSADVNESAVHSTLLENVSDFCRNNNLVIRDFPQTIEKRDQGFVIEQNKMVVSGNFRDALKLIYLLEQEKKMGQVISTDFKETIDKATKKKFLQTTLYFQKIRSNESTQ
jgi:hypothetical protein